MVLRSSILVVFLWCWRTGVTYCNNSDENLTVWNATVVTRLELTRFIENVTAYTDRKNTTNCVYLSLAGGNNYELDIVRIMNISVNGNLIIESNGSSSEITCTASLSDLDELSQIIKPLSGATLVLLDGLVFTGCPVPILIEEASNVVIQNCVFQHHEHGAISIYNSENVTVKNCTFHNNTSDSFFTRKRYQGSAGGLSIGYYNVISKTLFSGINVLIVNCRFTYNSAVISDRLRVTSTEALILNIFPGRGGALSMLFSMNSPLNFILNDSIILNNLANTFGGGVYCLTGRGSVYQTYMFANNIFMNNTAPIASGLSFINLLNRPVEFVVTNLIYNCTFVSNTARSKVAGAANVYPLYALRNNMVTFRDCTFYNNSALVYGGAVDITSYNFFENREAVFPIEFIDCIFDGNQAADGAAMNLAYYSAKFDNVTFMNNKESTIRAIGGRIDMKEEVNFVNNEVDGSVGGAIYLISSSQMFLETNTHLEFINNTGRSGAAIVAETPDVLLVFNRHFHNPLCFLQYITASVPPSEIGGDNVSMAFIGNNAIVGSAIYTNVLDFCAWSSYYPPFFNNISSVFRWPFISYVNNSLSDSIPVQTPAVDFVVQNETVFAYPGEPFKLRIIPYDEQNFTAANMFEIRGLINQSTDSDIDFVFSPTIRGLHPANLDYLARYNIRSTNHVTDYVADGILNMNYTIGVSAFRLESFDQIKYFQLTITSCPPGHVLHSVDASDEYECRCNVEDDQNIISCLQDKRKLILKKGYWGHTVGEESVNTMLEYYSCPPGYCRCSKVENISDACSNVYYYDNDDLQCVCDRQGYLCGKCNNGTGVSALLNNCVSCGHINILLIIALIIVDIIIITVILLTSATLLPWLYPFLYFVQVTPHIAQYFPVNFSTIQPYLHYLSSAVSLYFPYDFCLYPGMTAVASYSLRYIPFLLATIISVVFFTAHRKFRILIKNIRLSWSGLWVLIMLLYSDVVNTSVSILNCPMLTGYDGKKSLRWYVDGTVECFTGGHAALAVFAILILGFCTVIIVAVTAIVMEKIKTISIKRILQDPFRNDCQWWAPVELTRRFLLIIFIIIDPGNLAPVLLLTMAIVAVYLYAQPYQKLYINVLEAIMLVDVLLLLMITTAKDSLFGNHYTFDINQCGEITTISEQAMILALFYFSPLLLLLILVIAKLTVKSKLIHNIRGKMNRSKNDDEDVQFHFIDQPVRTCYLEFDDKYELNFNHENT